jgi:hypothetical protein
MPNRYDMPVSAGSAGLSCLPHCLNLWPRHPQHNHMAVTCQPVMAQQTCQHCTRPAPSYCNNYALCSSRLLALNHRGHEQKRIIRQATSVLPTLPTPVLQSIDSSDPAPCYTNMHAAIRLCRQLQKHSRDHATMLPRHACISKPSVPGCEDSTQCN